MREKAHHGFVLYFEMKVGRGRFLLCRMGTCLITPSIVTRFLDSWLNWIYPYCLENVSYYI